MLRRLFYRILWPHHPWRAVGISELSEMYIAGFLKNFSQGMIGVFVPLYLLKNGLSFQMVLVYYALVYASAVLMDLISAYLIAHFGPKHVMRLGFFIQFVYALLLTQIDSLPCAAIILSLTQAMAGSFYWLPYHVDFSKIKHRDHGGKELGWLQLLERLGGIGGPIAGGIIATLFGGHVLFMLSAGLLALAVITLMLSPEPVRVQQKLRFKGLLKGQLRNTASYASFVAENAISIVLWPTFLATVVFSADAYLKIGGVASISIAVTVCVALPLAHLLDKERGLTMLRVGTFLNAIVHGIRPFVRGFLGATGISFLNDPGTLVYRLPYLKGFYDSADGYPGQRVAYVAKNEMIAHVCCFIIFGVLALLVGVLSVHGVFVVGFLLGAVCSAGIQLQQYATLQARR